VKSEPTRAAGPADLRDVMIASFGEAVESGVDLVVVLGDSTSTSRITPFRERWPGRVVDVGIAEQNVVGVAVGLSLGGFVAVTANAAPFLVARANEQVKNDVCYSNTNVKLVGLNAGVCYGNLASTHHAIDDISIMRGLGNILILAPSDPPEAAQIFRFALEHVGPVYIRMDSARFPTLHGSDYRFRPGAVDILRAGGALSVAAVGSVVHEAAAAAAELAGGGVEVQLLNLPSLRPIDREALARALDRTPAVISVEEHSRHGGLGSLVAETIAEAGLRTKLLRLGFPEGEFAKAGPRAEIRAHYGIDRAGIVKAAQALLR
jgi:transketolase